MIIDYKTGKTDKEVIEYLESKGIQIKYTPIALMPIPLGFQDTCIFEAYKMLKKSDKNQK